MWNQANKPICKQVPVHLNQIMPVIGSVEASEVTRRVNMNPASPLMLLTVVASTWECKWKFHSMYVYTSAQVQCAPLCNTTAQCMIMTTVMLPTACLCASVSYKIVPSTLPHYHNKTWPKQHNNGKHSRKHCNFATHQWVFGTGSGSYIATHISLNKPCSIV